MGFDFVDEYIVETERMPSPKIYRQWAAITALSGVLERKVWTIGSSGPIYPNILTVLVGPPACGKTNAIRPVRDMWSKVKEMPLAPDNVTKPSLLDCLKKSSRMIKMGSNGTTRMEYHSCMGVAVSEFGVFFPKHDTEFLSVVNHLYDNPQQYTEERRTAGELQIDRPGMVMLAGTQPDFLNSFLPEEAWGMGFTSRLMFIYADKAPKGNVFQTQVVNYDRFIRHLNEIHYITGEYNWSEQAALEINEWNENDNPPAPKHSKLQHYLGRRTLLAIKLSMIANASRGMDKMITVEDFEKAKSWLLEAEDKMPDIFRAMNMKSDFQIIVDLHYNMYQKYSSVAIDDRKAISRQWIAHFLHQRVPTEKVDGLIKMAVDAGYMKIGKYPDEWIPELITKYGETPLAAM